MAPRLNIIIGSTRPTRQGPAVAKWFEQFAKADGTFDPVLVDIAAFNLPVFDEPKHPAMQQYEHAHTKKWAESVASADAYVFVTPEYNFNPPPSLINALDYLVKEWNYKPAGIVSYGGMSGGLRAAQALKLLLTSLKIMPLPEGVGIPAFTTFIKDGTFTPNDLITTGATTMLAELGKWSAGLKAVRG